MGDTINDIAAKIGGQDNKVNNGTTDKNSEFITEAELTDKLYELNMEEEEEEDRNNPKFCEEMHNYVHNEQTKILYPILNEAFTDEFFLGYKDYILDEVCSGYVYRVISSEQVQELVTKIKNEITKRHVFDKHYFTLQKKYNSNSNKSITDYSRFGNYSIDNIGDILRLPFVFFCEDMNIPTDVRLTVSSAIEESILRNKHGFTDVPVAVLNDTVKKAKDYGCDDILSIFFELDTTLENIIEYANIKLMH